MWQSFAAIGRETAEISRWIKKKEKKKQQQNIMAARALRYRNGRPQGPSMGGPNNRDSVYGAVIIAEPLQEFTWIIWWM